MVGIIKALQNLVLHEHPELSGIDLLSTLRAFVGANGAVDQLDKLFKELVTLDKNFEVQLKPEFITRTLTQSIPRLQRANRAVQKYIDDVAGRMKSMGIPSSILEVVNVLLKNDQNDWAKLIQHLAKELTEYDKNPTLVNTETRKELRKLIEYVNAHQSSNPDLNFITEVIKMIERIQKETIVSDLKTELMNMLKQLRHNTDFDEPLSHLSSIGRFKDKLDRRNRLLPLYTLKV